MLPAVVLGVGLVLLVLWAVTNNRHLERRRQQNADWDGGEERPDLWTSSGACIHCGAHGGLLELAGDDVMFSCLACGRRHVRQSRS